MSEGTCANFPDDETSTYYVSDSRRTSKEFDVSAWDSEKHDEAPRPQRSKCLRELPSIHEWLCGTDAEEIEGLIPGITTEDSRRLSKGQPAAHALPLERDPKNEAHRESPRRASRLSAHASSSCGVPKRTDCMPQLPQVHEWLRGETPEEIQSCLPGLSWESCESISKGCPAKEPLPLPRDPRAHSKFGAAAGVQKSRCGKKRRSSTDVRNQVSSDSEEESSSSSEEEGSMNMGGLLRNAGRSDVNRPAPSKSLNNRTTVIAGHAGLGLRRK